MLEKEAVYSPKHGVGTVVKDNSANEAKAIKKAKFEDGEVRSVDESMKQMINS